MLAALQRMALAEVEPTTLQGHCFTLICMQEGKVRSELMIQEKQGCMHTAQLVRALWLADNAAETECKTVESSVFALA